MKKPVIFISHITEEKQIALELKALIESHFLHAIEVFVSTDPASLRLGRKWLDRITDALKVCKVEIILASPESIKRPWINFEAGSGWVRDIPVIPLCHSGMTPEKLPDPLGSLMSASINEAGMTRVFFELTSASNGSQPKVDFSEFIASVKNFETISKDIAKLENASPLKPLAGLLPHELQTLVAVGEADNTVSTSTLKSNLGNEGLTVIAVSLALKMLERKGFIVLKMEPDWNNSDYEVAQVTESGWEWLESNIHVLKLTCDPPKDPPSIDDDFAPDMPPF